jgi:hypothetical protein
MMITLNFQDMQKVLFSGLLSIITCFSLLAQEPVMRPVQPFSKLEVSDKIIVRLVKADKEAISIIAQGVDPSTVKTEVTDQTLSIKLFGEPFTKKKITITLNYVVLKAISISGGADVSTTSLMKTDALLVELQSGGIFYLDADIKNFTAKLTEGATLSASGYADNTNITVATGATFSGYDLETEICKVKATSGGKAKINVVSELDAETASKGYISYKGNPPSFHQNATSSGSISKYEP